MVMNFSLGCIVHLFPFNQWDRLGPVPTKRKIKQQKQTNKKKKHKKKKIKNKKN